MMEASSRAGFRLLPLAPPPALSSAWAGAEEAACEVVPLRLRARRGDGGARLVFELADARAFGRKGTRPAALQKSDALGSFDSVSRSVLRRLRQLPAGTRRLIAGGISGGISKTATAPLETIKMQLVQGGNVTILDSCRAIFARSGVAGFFYGNTIDVLRTVPSKALELAAFDYYKRALRASGWLPEAAVGMVAGGLAGVSSTVFVYPLETIRTRMAVNGQSFMTTMASTPAQGGMRGLFRGLDASLIGVVPYTAIRLCMYDALKLSWKKASGKDQIDPQAALAFGAIAGVVSATATFPLEVARRRMMVSAAYPHTAAAIATIVRQEGVGALFNGVWLSLVKQAPQYAITFMVYEQCKQWLDL